MTPGRPDEPRSGNPLDDALRRPDDLAWAHEVDGAVESEPEDFAWRRSRRVVRGPATGTRPPAIRAHSLEEAWDRLVTRTRAYMDDPDPPHVLLVRATAGGGKTHAAAALAHQLSQEGKFGAFVIPRHAMYPELMEIVRKIGGTPERWYHWLPHQDETGWEQTPTCKHWRALQLMGVRGLRLTDGCAYLRGCGHTYMQEVCPYHGQTRAAGHAGADVVVIQHNHLAVKHPLAHEFGYVIGDESPLDAILRPWRVPAGAIVPTTLTPKPTFLPVLEELARLATTDQTLSGATLIEALCARLGGHAALLEACAEQAAAPTTPGSVIRDPNDAVLLDFAHATPLARTLLRETVAHRDGIDFASRVRIGAFERDRDEGGLEDTATARRDRARVGLTLRARWTVDWRSRSITTGYPDHVIWCDATGDARFYEMLFQRPVEEVRVDIVARQRVFQVVDRMNGVGALCDLRTRALTEAGTQLVEDAERIGAQARARGRIVGLVGLKRMVEDGHFDRAVSWDPVTGAPLVESFMAQRGTNRLAGVDTLIVAGMWQLPADALHALALSLILDRDQDGRLTGEQRLRAFATGGKLERVLVRRAYDHDAPDGLESSIEVADYADGDLSALFWQKRDAETIQSIGRARGVRRGEERDPVEVWLLTNLPTEMAIERLMTRAELYGAPTNVYLPERWPTVVAVAEEIADELGYVTAQELWVRLSARLPAGPRAISRTTVGDYVAKLAASGDGWASVPPGEVVALRTRGRGRPPVSVLVHRSGNQS